MIVYWDRAYAWVRWMDAAVKTVNSDNTNKKPSKTGFIQYYSIFIVVYILERLLPANRPKNSNFQDQQKREPRGRCILHQKQLFPLCYAFLLSRIFFLSLTLQFGYQYNYLH